GPLRYCSARHTAACRTHRSKREHTFRNATACALNRDAGIMAPGKAAPVAGSTRPRGLPHAADANALKSPDSAAVVGTNTVLVGGAVRKRVPWYPPKMKSRFFTIGPPAVPPN